MLSQNKHKVWSIENIKRIQLQESEFQMNEEENQEILYQILKTADSEEQKQEPQRPERHHVPSSGFQIDTVHNSQSQDKNN